MAERARLASCVGPRDSKGSVGRRATLRPQLRIRPAHRNPLVAERSKKYTAVAVVIHWLMALLVFILIRATSSAHCCTCRSRRVGAARLLRLNGSGAEKKGPSAPFYGYCRCLTVVDVHRDFKTEPDVVICRSFPSHVCFLFEWSIKVYPGRSDFHAIPAGTHDFFGYTRVFNKLSHFTMAAGDRLGCSRGSCWLNLATPAARYRPISVTASCGAVRLRAL